MQALGHVLPELRTMKRILAVDGGGVRGALTSCFLVELERQLGKPCREIFDFVAGTSTGALIAAGIAVGLPATQILLIYQSKTKDIFPYSISSPQGWIDRLRQGWAYDPHGVQKVLKDEFGPAARWKLNDCPIRILLTAKGVNNHPWYFVRDNPKNAQTTGGLSLLDCAVASACAPTYFAPWYVNPGKTLVGWCYDGGVGTVGNPVYQVCREAFQFDTFDPADTQVISLGTGFYPSTEINPPDGFLPTLEWTLNALVDAPIDEQTQIVNERWPRILQRFNWLLPAAIDEADTSAIPGLVTLGQQLAAQMDWKSILQ